MTVVVIGSMRFSPEECEEEPAFAGKNTLEVMPYLYSFVYAASPLLFVRQLNALRKMPKRYHRWYGDQMTLKSELDAPGRFSTRPRRKIAAPSHRRLHDALAALPRPALRLCPC